ncbi:MAG: protein FxsA, partial [Frankiaceae bacterium]|nr:protein FxsA [Frankiaceae bacterium]
MLSGRQGTDVPALLLVALLVVPLLELYVILQVADVIGGWQTLVVLVAESVLGTWLVRREGRR